MIALHYSRIAEFARNSGFPDFHNTNEINTRMHLYFSSEGLLG
jgi:hypothetical protein